MRVARRESSVMSVRWSEEAPALKTNLVARPDGSPGRMHTMSNATAVTDADFELQVEQHEGLTVVDFWATWCGPCRMIAPILDQLAVEYDGQVKVTKLDVDANIKTATRFNVRSIPMLLFFKGGKVVDQIVGAVPRQAIEAKLKQHVA
jgi:thioredoxin 1